MTKTPVQNMECQIPKEKSEDSRKNQHQPYPTAITSTSNHGTAPPTTATVADTEDARKHASAGSVIHAKAGMIQWSNMTKASAQNMKDQTRRSNPEGPAKTIALADMECDHINIHHSYRAIGTCPRHKDDWQCASTGWLTRTQAHNQP